MHEYLLAFSVLDWFWDSWWELKYYSSHIGKTGWLTLSACTVAFGLMCMRGNSLKA